MKKWLFTFLIVVLSSYSLLAQSIEDGINALYYEKYKLAQDIFGKIVSARPKDTKAIYWLGQSFLQNPNISDGVEKARNVYQSALQNNFNAAFLLVGMGEIDLLNTNDITAAKQKFEQARLSSSDAPDILNAIGRANTVGSKLTGDPGYAIELLKKAAVEEPKNTDILYNLAINTLKLDDNFNSPAIDVLLNATKINPQYAKAFYEIGHIYQKLNKVELSQNYFQKAIASDPNFGPTYFALYNMEFEKKDYGTAEQNLKKYISLTETKNENQYYLAHLQLKSVHKTDAQKSIANYLSNASKESMKDDAYFIAAEAYSTNPDSAKKYYVLTFEKDTSIVNKIISSDSLASLYQQERDSINTYNWLKKQFLTIPFSNQDYKYKNVLPKLCSAILKAAPVMQDNQEFTFSDSVFQLYIAANPDKEFGYFGRTKNALNADLNLSKIEIPVAEYIVFLEKDKGKNKQKLLYYYDLLGQYFSNIAKNYKASAFQYEKILSIDPGNTRAKNILEKIKSAKNN